MKFENYIIHPTFKQMTVSVLFTILSIGVWSNHTLAGPHTSPEKPYERVTEGSLLIMDQQGELTNSCPLQQTDVRIEISGFLARTTVVQHFSNPFPEKIEAVYVFPLPNRAAIDDMTLTVGDRVVKGKIKRREEARVLYEAARAQGHVAGILDQERPNIFTQSVANIMPGEKVAVTISYVETLTYKDGAYQLVFPMVVGPRYIPGVPTGQIGGGWAYDTDQVPDASTITPPVTPPGTRAGHDISITVAVDAGLPLNVIASPSHSISIDTIKPNRAVVRLQTGTTIPNKDFLLTYNVAGEKIQDAVLTHREGNDGFFTLILQPPDRVIPDDVTPKELVFVLDTSGSMSGFPIEKAKETMALALKGLNPHDTFNLITFAGDTHVLFPEPVSATRDNLRKAQEFLQSRRGSGGTEMMKAIRTALEPSDSPQHIRIVCFMTDGYVGNDMAILDEVQQHPNARIFSFGIGNSVNRFLLDNMAEYGRGEVEYVGLQDDGSAAAQRFYKRIRHPLLTDISIDWGDLEVTDVYPKRLPDLFSAKPLILTGRYTQPRKSNVKIHGTVSGLPVVREVELNFPESETSHKVLAALWARLKIAHLLSQDFKGIQQGRPNTTISEAITQLGLNYRLMTQFTSFVAVEEMTVTEGGEPRRIDVPVEIPDGVSYEGVFGDRNWESKGPTSGLRAKRSIRRSLAAPPASTMRPNRIIERSQVFAAPEEDWINPAEPTDRVFKFHKSLRNLRERMKTNAFFLTPDDKRFVKQGKAEIQIWLSEINEETLHSLRHLGVELLLQPKMSKLVIGRIPISKLEELAQLKVVRYVAPLPSDT